MFVEGNPAPTFRFFWTKNDKEVDEGGRYKFMSGMNTIAELPKQNIGAVYTVCTQGCRGRKREINI